MAEDMNHISFVILYVYYKTAQHTRGAFCSTGRFSGVKEAGFGLASAKEETSFGSQQLNVTLNNMNSMNP